MLIHEPVLCVVSKAPEKSLVLLLKFNVLSMVQWRCVSNVHKTLQSLSLACIKHWAAYDSKLTTVAHTLLLYNEGGNFCSCHNKSKSHFAHLALV